MIRNKKGYTLIELVTVIAISTILLGIAVPSLIGFIRHGRATNDAEIAEMIYSVAQDQLSELFIEEELDEFSESTILEGDTYKVSSDQNLGDNYPINDMDNGDDVYYIEKPQGEPDPNNKVVQLIESEVSNPEVMNGAILIEYNVKTGKVLSVFYSSEEGADLDYIGDGSDNDIYGARKYSNEDAKQRKQGYYGTDFTGFTSTSNVDTLINVYDGKSKPLISGNMTYENVLYAEAFILCEDVDASNDLFTFTVYDDTGSTILYRTELIDLRDQTIPDTPEEAIAKRDGTSGQEEAIYKVRINGGNDVDPSNDVYQVVWILDWKENTNILETEPYNVINNLVVSGPQDIKVGISANTSNGMGKEVISTTFENTHFANVKSDGSMDNPYQISSERHLYNVRYALDMNFIQVENLDLNEINSTMTQSNFEPIGMTSTEPFSGTYHAKSSDGNYTIENFRYLNDSRNPTSASGLFGYVTGDISNIDLVNPYVVSADTAEPSTNEGTGTLVGVLGNASGTDPGTVRYINVISNETIQNPTADDPINKGKTMVYGDDRTKGENLGGVVGLVNANSFVQDCIVLPGSFGEANTPLVSNGTDFSTSGGIVGTNKGTIERVVFGGIAPTATINNVVNIYPIVGDNVGGTATQAYYLSGKDIRTNTDYNLTELPPEDTYSTKIGTVSLYEMFNTTPWDGWEVTTGIPNVLDPLSTDYPYPHFGGDQNSYWFDASNPYITLWPIVKPIDPDEPTIPEAVSHAVYYEEYSDGTTGYYYFNVDDKPNGEPIANSTLYEAEDGDNPFPEDVYVIDEGYYILFPEIKTYQLEFYDGPAEDANLLYSKTIEPDEYYRYKITQEDCMELIEAGWNPINYVTIKAIDSTGENVLVGKNGGLIQYNPLFRAQVYVKDDKNTYQLDPTNVEIVSTRHLHNICYLFTAGDTSLDGFVFNQVCDIHLTSTYTQFVIGNVDGGPMQAFDSVYDGHGFEIYNMAIDATGENSGMFGMLGPDAVVTNIEFVNPVITSSSPQTPNNVGIVSGSATESTVSNISVKNGSLALEDSSNVGGILGSAESVAINNIVIANTTIQGNQCVGGIIGYSLESALTDAIVVNSSTECSIRSTSGSDSVGGFIGEAASNRDIISEVVFYGIAPNSSDELKPIVGTTPAGEPNMSDTYYLANTTGYNSLNPNYGTPQTTSELENLSMGDQNNWYRISGGVTGVDDNLYNYPVVITSTKFKYDDIIFPVAN